MRLTLVVVLCVLIAVAHSAAIKATTPRATSKAPAPRSAYAYLRSIRGTKSCAGGSCPFWERHGRSFAALRCYSREYQECTCLHRMCFSSCMFTKKVCNEEMVQCLRQICPRCMPASAKAMCSVYDSTAERVAEALSVFACYSCCPVSMNAANGNSSMNAVRTTTPIPGLLPNAVANLPPGGNLGATNTITPINGAPINGIPPNGAPVNGAPPNGAPVNGAPVNGAPVNGAPTNGAPVNGVPVNGAPGNAIALVNGGTGNVGNVPSNVVPDPGVNRRVQKTVRTTKRVVTTRRATATTRRATLTTRRAPTTTRANNVKNAASNAASALKKPQANDRIKS